MTAPCLPDVPKQALLDKESIWHGLLCVIDESTNENVVGASEVDTVEGWVKVSDRSLEPPKIIYDEPPKSITLHGHYRLEWTDEARLLFSKIRHESVRTNGEFEYLTPSLVKRMVEIVCYSGLDYGETRKDCLAFYGLKNEIFHSRQAWNERNHADIS